MLLCLFANVIVSYIVGITVMGMLSALVFPLVFLFELDVTLKLTIAMIALAFVTLAISLLIFGPKAKSLFEGDEVDENMQIKKTSNSNSGGSYMQSEIPTASIVKKTSAKYENGNAKDLMFNKQMDGRKLPPEERYRVCKEQVEMWSSLLAKMDQDSDARSSGSHNSSYASQGPNMDIVNVSTGKDEIAFHV